MKRMRIRIPDLKTCLCQDGERSRRRSRLSSVCEEGWGDSPLYESLEEIHVLGNASKIKKNILASSKMAGYYEISNWPHIFSSVRDPDPRIRTSALTNGSGFGSNSGSDSILL